MQEEGAKLETQFSRLLGIAAFACWESDAELRLTRLLRRDDDGRFVPVDLSATDLAASPMAPFDADAAVRQWLRQALQRGRPFADLPMRWSDGGATHILLVSGEPRRHGSAADGYWGVACDITVEHRARLAHERSQALLAKMVTASPDVVLLTDLATGRIELVNQAFERVSGYSAARAGGRTAGEINLWPNAHEHESLMARLLAEGVVDDLALELRAADGHVRPMRVSAARFEHDGRAYAVISARDATASERVRLEREAVLANASIGIVISRLQRIEMMNRHAERLFASTGGRLIGRTTRDLLADPATFDAVRHRQVSATQANEGFSAELRLRRCDGSEFLASVRSTPIDAERPLEGGTVWIVEDVTERRRMEQALARARDDAESASRAKSAFLANTSHEIRTPLNGLLGLARLARQPDLDDARRRQYLEQIADSAEGLSSIITDILDLSKIEAGKLDVASVPFDLHELLDRLRRAYAALADAQGLNSALRIEPGLRRWVHGDPVRLRQVLSNYLNNALKFTTRGHIDLVARRTAATHIRFEVNDTGPGIEHAAQARLFRPFTQVDDSSARRFGGTGLGLSICRELATLMGGEVGVVSHLGQGSVFWLDLPLPEAAREASGAQLGVPSDDPLRAVSVLLVEDNAVNMMIAAAMLEEWGMRVSQVSDGQAAIKAVDDAAARGQQFDVVLMDVQMPGMTGHEATREIRRRHPAIQLPVIALTAAALLSERDAAFAAGMTDFVTKPIDAQRLRKALLKALQAQ